MNFLSFSLKQACKEREREHFRIDLIFISCCFLLDDGLSLPTRQSDEFRPFIRRLPEFKFWYSATKATLIAFTCTFFDFFNIPVFWPILVMYFITLFCITMKRQIKVSTQSRVL